MNIKHHIAATLIRTAFFLGVTIVFLFFGQPSGTVQATSVQDDPSFVSQPSPTLTIPDRIPAMPGASVTLPVGFTANGNEIAGLSFSIDYDHDHLVFDPADNNSDGIPDAIVFSSSLSPFLKQVTTELDNIDAEISFFIFSFAPTPPILSTGTILSITFEIDQPIVAAVEAPVNFAQDPAPVFSDADGQTVPGSTDDGSVQITGPCYTLQTSITPSDAGTVSASIAANCEGNKYTAGTILQLTANASTGYSFTTWSGDVTGSSNPVSVTINRNTNIVATFTSQGQSLYLPKMQRADESANSWVHSNISQLAGNAPVAAGNPRGYVTPGTGSHHVYYRGFDNHIHELFWNNDVWVHNNLSQLADSAPLAAGDPLAYTTPNTGSHHVYYRGADNDIHELFWNNNAWVHNNLSQLASDAPAAASDPSGYVTPDTGSHHVYYRGFDNQIHELFWSNNAWVHNNLSQLADNAPLAAGDPASYATPGTDSHHVYYRGADNQIHELFWSNGTWTSNNLSQLAGNAPTASGDPTAYTPNTGSHHVYYRGTDNQIHELLWSDDAWVHNNLSQLAGNAPASVGNPAGYVTPGTTSHYVDYRSTDNQIHEIFWNNSVWVHNNVSQLAGNAPAAAEDPTGFITPGTGSHYIYYRGIDNQIHELYMDASADGLVAYWSLNDGTALDNSGAGLTGTIFGTPDVVDGAVKKALQFDGNDYIQVPDFRFVNRSQLSVAAWVKPIAMENQALEFVSKHSSPTDVEILLRAEEDGKYDVEWTIGGNFYDLSASSVGEIDDVGLITPRYDEFDFLTAVYTGQQIQFYVNGTLVKAVDATGEIAINDHLLTIGAYAFDPASNRLNGTIDEIRIYNRALNESEIQALYEPNGATSTTDSEK